MVSVSEFHRHRRQEIIQLINCQNTAIELHISVAFYCIYLFSSLLHPILCVHIDTFNGRINFASRIKIFLSWRWFFY